MNAAVKRAVRAAGVVETIPHAPLNSRQDNSRRALRVLCATDFSAQSEHAFERAILLSRQTGAQLLFLHVVDERQSLRIIGRRADRAHSALQWQLRQLSHSNPRVAEVTVRVGKPWRTIALAAKEWRADIVVLGAYRRRVAERFFGTTAERVAREAACSVLTVNCAPQTPYHSVLLAADLSPGFVSVARMTQEFGLLDQAKATIVHETSGLPKPSFACELTKQLELAGLDASRFEFLEKQGRPVDAIARAAARTRADLVVVGLSRYTRVQRALGAGVSNQSLRQIGSDVLTVPLKAVQRSMALQSDADAADNKAQGGWLAALQSRSLVVFKVWQSDRDHDSGSQKEAQA